MTQQRKSKRPAEGFDGPAATAIEGSRPLSARSVIASTLLGVEPPRLPSRLLVRSGELFGISEGTTRVALSRMVNAQELELEDGWYGLAGRLLTRQFRQTASRRAEHRAWTGTWQMAVVSVDRRDAGDRAALRDAMRQLKLAELREGVWLRPDNLGSPAERAPGAAEVVTTQCRWFGGVDPVPSAPSAPAALAAELWDLDAWASIATGLRRQMDAIVGGLEAGDPGSLAPGFVLSATVLRHMLADPVLPDELLPAHWPGTELRAEYDRYDQAFKDAWGNWFLSQL